MTFSIVGASPDNTTMSVAVASKFLGVGAYVSAAASGAGALATQALGNVALRTEGIELMRAGHSAAETLNQFLENDARRTDGRRRQAR